MPHLKSVKGRLRLHQPKTSKAIQLGNLDPLKLEAIASTSSSHLSQSAKSDRAKSNTIVEEGCLVTRTRRHTHEAAHIVNAVRSDHKRKRRVELYFIKDLMVVGLAFGLDDVSNKIILDQTIHRSLDKYSFITFVPCLDVVDALSRMIIADNKVRQETADRVGLPGPRTFNLMEYPVVGFKMELIAMHPFHFLPDGMPLAIWDPELDNYSFYFATSDGLRRGTDHRSALNGPFMPPLAPPPRAPDRAISAFLVVIAASIKIIEFFTCYPQKKSALPAEKLRLMEAVVELADLIYLPVVPRPDTLGAFVQNPGDDDVNDTARETDVQSGGGKRKRGNRTGRGDRGGGDGNESGSEDGDGDEGSEDEDAEVSDESGDMSDDEDADANEVRRMAFVLLNKCVSAEDRQALTATIVTGRRSHLTRLWELQAQKAAQAAPYNTVSMES